MGLRGWGLLEDGDLIEDGTYQRERADFNFPTKSNKNNIDCDIKQDLPQDG